ncbi:MAG: hypothetical protein IPL25_19095 [Saprospiraceae bacterium]|nr:hypothetical protein [Candidatus Vicinibacter affinis]
MSYGFRKKDPNTSLFKFRYGGISMVINLLGRTYEWSDEYFDKEEQAQIWPERFKKKDK